MITVQEYQHYIKMEYRSPLAETRFSKKMVRETAKSVGLSVYDKPSNSCLASRIPWGQSVTAERLARIEIGEKIVRQLTGAKQVRVRDMNGIARIEVGADELSLLENNVSISKNQKPTKTDKFRRCFYRSRGLQTWKN